MIDTPGLFWETEERTLGRENIRVRDILLRAKGRMDRMKDPTLTGKHISSSWSPVAKICLLVADIVSRSAAEDLMLLYNLPAFTKDDPDSFLSGLARSDHLVKKVCSAYFILVVILRGDCSTGNWIY